MITPSLSHSPLSRPHFSIGRLLPALSPGLRRLARSRALFATLITLSALLATPPRAAAQLIDTATPWLADGANSWASPFGEPAWAAWGQTFVTPTGYPKLQSFSVWVQSTNQYGDGYVDAVDFDGRIYEWNTSARTLVGSALYLSSPKHIPHEDNGAAQEVAFAVGGLTLDPTKTYMFFLSAQDYFDGQAGVLTMGAFTGYAGGANFISGSSYADLFTTPWEDNGEAGDMVFRARFSALTPVPEPSTYGAVAAGLLAGLVIVRQRHRSAASSGFRFWVGRARR